MSRSWRTELSSAGLACIVDAIPAAERAEHGARIRRLFRSAAVVATPLDEGYAFEFSIDWLDELFAWLRNERKCCPFLAFELNIAPRAEAITLRITGPEGTKAFLDAELLGQGS